MAAHGALIAALQADIADLDDDTTTITERGKAQQALTDAQAEREKVQTAINNANRDTTIGKAVTDAEDAAGKLESDRSAEDIQAAKDTIQDAKDEIAKGDDADAYSDEISAAEDAVARAEARNSIEAAIEAARVAARALTAASTESDVTAAQTLITTATRLVSAAAGDDHISGSEEDAYEADIADVQAPVTLAKSQNDADQAAKDEEEREQRDKATADMVVMAKKLFNGIARQFDGTTKVDFDADSVPVDATDGTFDAGYSASGDIIVAIARAAETGTTENPEIFTLDNKEEVSGNYEWEGVKYTDETGGDSYEAVVYSNVEDPEEGAKFNDNGNGGYELNAEGVLAMVPDTNGTSDDNIASQKRVTLTGVTRTAGMETLKFPENNPANASLILVSGSYHGVSGDFRCAPTDADNGCTAAVAGEGGFILDGGTWSFKPSDPEAKVTEVADSDYSSYGWWLKKTEDGQYYDASAFHDFRGADSTPIAVPNAGTTKYEGGAAGKYAFSSSTGGLNEAGHFTARAVLEAKFGAGTNDTITGTIDAFKVGDDGEDRTWVVHLHEGGIAASGGITRARSNDTTWEMAKDDENASASGDWSGQLREQGDDGVPGAATGVFYSEYGNTGKMVGAFGATVE